MNILRKQQASIPLYLVGGKTVLDQTQIMLIATFVAAMAAMILLWALSLALRDASIVDIFWGAGFVIIAAVNFSFTEGFMGRRILILSLVAVWGMRLALHIFFRNRGRGEDPRYQAMRRRHGKRFWIVSLYSVFGFQGVLMWVISLPLQIAASSKTPDRFTAFDYLGVAVWTVGFFFEAVGDWQLKRFKSDPSNKGKMMRRGLWAWTRHPNYFGDATLWWGYFLIALSTDLGVWTLASPLIMTFLLMKVSGVALLEKSLAKTKPGYRDYVRQTSAFFPLPPRKK
ncbi:MAG: DUF1295 domain-containing protein [Acidobacteriota bacterium]